MWNQRDPAMDITYYCPPSGSGAGWASKSKTEGDGRMTFTTAEPGKRLGDALYFPDFGTTSTGDLLLRAAGSGTQVVWLMNGDMGRKRPLPLDDALRRRHGRQGFRRRPGPLEGTGRKALRSPAGWAGSGRASAVAQCAASSARQAAIHVSMPLVKPLPTDHDPEVEHLAQFFNTTLGFPPHSVLTMMRRPALARAFTELNRAVMADEAGSGRVTAELKRLLGHIASRVAGCRYCEAHTIRAAARFGAQEGAAPARLDEVWNFRTSALFTTAERAALEYAAAAASVPGAVTPKIGAELRRHWDDGEIVEITGVIALVGFLNRWNDAMATELEAPAAADGQRWLAPHGWTAGKHAGLDSGLDLSLDAGLQRIAT